MATKQSSKATEEKTASRLAATKPSETATPTSKKTTRTPGFLRALTKPFRMFGGYVKGSWQELRQVYWPSRRATWGLTLAVILFTLFFVVIIVALDTGFNELFKRILL